MTVPATGYQRLLTGQRATRKSCCSVNVTPWPWIGTLIGSKPPDSWDQPSYRYEPCDPPNAPQAVATAAMAVR